MSEARVPILLSFYAVAGETSSLVYGQLTYTGIRNFTFQNFSRLRTFRTLLRLYRTKPFADQEIMLTFSNQTVVHAHTDVFGAFSVHTHHDIKGVGLQKVTLDSGADVTVLPSLYPVTVIDVQSDTIVITDVDDTILHSFISSKGKKLRTLMFTTMEKRKAVTDMHALLQQFSDRGASLFYLSNSEQNLHPLIYRFLEHNGFPRGPLFLKKMRRLWHALWNIKFPLRNLHKEETIAVIKQLFPSGRLVLVGDNTQHDLTIYLAAAAKFPRHIGAIVILKLKEKAADHDLIARYEPTLRGNNIKLFYTDKVPAWDMLEN